MNEELFSQLKNLSKKLNDFYSEEYLSEEDEYLANKEIKSELIEFIIKSNDSSEFLLVQNALLLLFDNTGCQEDFEILDEIISPLFEKNILDDKLLEKYCNNSPLSRWR
ncbi:MULTISPECIES: hypothetical protein [Phytobacter]|jgi:hypothetical protein|uniref:hypothetical protein n=1 Tax=Phytobacter TaxID=447792 RepID=UPI001CC4EC40|nr:MULTISPECIES: hypothetical protein [Phytobacter]MDU7195733.1 hypothetical protein [Streptococcus sp.]MDU7201164.1 hypothetical protein [Enterobacteriaceae bacterium]MDV2905238.1 hypothetical protein [Phytobacter diazotrophicus]